jgi:hypothetical protein
VQHIAVGLRYNPIHFDHDGAAHKILSAEVDACTMPRPSTGDEATERQRSTYDRKNKASVIAGDL